MKCRVSKDSTVCERCTRKSLDCVFQNHRRGRKLGTRLNALHSENRSRTLLDLGTSEPPADCTADTQAPTPSVLNERVSRNVDVHLERAKAGHHFWTNTEGFQPPR